MIRATNAVLVLTMFLAGASALAGNEVLNQDAIRAKLGIDAYPVGASIQNLKVAILDNGFAGYEPGKGLLPDSTEFISGPQNPPLPTPHGFGMAEILWSALGRPVLGPKFYLINANGWTNLKAAIQFVIDQHVDIVLYSQVWTFGDNFDGKGFINAEVSRAVRAGTIWVNAAGNFGGMAYNGTVTPQLDRDSRLLQFNGADHLRFTNTIDENAVTVTLSWSDFTDSERDNATKDLDLFIYDTSGKLVGSSELVQRGEAPPTGAASNLSSYAREVVTLPRLDRGEYWIRVKAKSDNFTATDRFRVVLESERAGSIVFNDHTQGGEVPPPADNPDVITVGERTALSSVGTTVGDRSKPDVLVDDATVQFSNGTTTQGSSNAAAMFAAAITAMKAYAPALTGAKLQTYLAGVGSVQSSPDLAPIAPAMVNPWIYSVSPQGSRVMLHRNGHLVVLTPVDPIQLPIFKNAGAYRVRPDDLLIISPMDQHWYSVRKDLAYQIVPPLVEFRQMSGAGSWAMPTPSVLAQILGQPGT